MRVNRAGLADAHGVSENTITNWLEEGLPRARAAERRGQSDEYDVAETIRWRLAREAGKGAIDEDGQLINVDAERARLTKEQADKVAMENEVRRGRLVDAEHVAALWANTLTNVKNRMLGIPTRAAPLVIGRKAVPEVREIIKRFIVEALNELSAADPTVDPSGEEWTEASTGTDGEPMGGPKAPTKRRKQRRAGPVVN